MPYQDAIAQILGEMDTVIAAAAAHAPPSPEPARPWAGLGAGLDSSSSSLAGSSGSMLPLPPARPPTFAEALAQLTHAHQERLAAVTQGLPGPLEPAVLSFGSIGSSVLLGAGALGARGKEQGGSSSGGASEPPSYDEVIAQVMQAHALLISPHRLASAGLKADDDTVGLEDFSNGSTGATSVAGACPQPRVRTRAARLLCRVRALPL